MPRLKPKRRTTPPQYAPYREPERYPEPEPRSNPLKLPGKLMRSLSLLSIGSAITLSAILGIGLLRAGDNFVSEVKEIFNAPQPQPEVDVRSVVVQQIKEVSELSTAVFSMEAVVPSKRDRTLGNLTVGSTTLLYIAYGEVRAGVDLSQLQPSNITVTATPSGEQLTIQLPPAQILDQKIDISRSQVYDYDRGFLGLGPDSAVELQSVASQAALNKIVTAACQQGILQQASDRARLVVTQLMTTAGQSVVVETSPAQGCGAADSNSGASNAKNLNRTPERPPQ